MALQSTRTMEKDGVMPESLFNSDEENYTEVAKEIYWEFDRAIKPIIDKWSDKFSVRQIQSILFDCIFGLVHRTMTLKWYNRIQAEMADKRKDHK